MFTTAEFLSAVKAQGHLLYPPTTLVSIENTHNRMGGIVFPQEEVVLICAAAREYNIASYLDGARLWNTAAASGLPLAVLAAPFDLVSVALSKGLGHPADRCCHRTRDRPRTRYRRIRAERCAGRHLSGAGTYALDKLSKGSARTMLMHG